jgi:hypothetical protein
MAKLKARGREEIFRVTISRPAADTSTGVETVQDFRSLMSDGNILTRRLLRYTPEEAAKNYGKRSHDYGWTVKGRARAGLSLEQLLKIYLDKGWEVVEVSGNYFRRQGSMVEALSQEPFISLETAEKRKTVLAKSHSKAEAKRKEKTKLENGPGFYVTNNFLTTGSRGADHEKPFPTFEAAESFALKQLATFRASNFGYLLPVIVIEADSRELASTNKGHVWWIDGQFKGPAVDPRQTGFGF